MRGRASAFSWKEGETVMSEENVQAETGMEGGPMPTKQGLAILGIVVVAMVAVTVAAMALGCDLWIVYMGLCLWSTLGQMKVEPAEVAKLWCGAAFGLALGFFITHGPETLGLWALALAALILLTFVFGFITNRWGLVCNGYATFYLTVATANGLPLTALGCVKSLAFGFAVFGLIPLVASKVMAKRARG